MSGTAFLQLFLLLQIFIMGVAVALAARYAYAHFKLSRAHKNDEAQPTPEELLTPEAKERLKQLYASQYQSVLQNSAAELHRDLQLSTKEINNLVNQLATNIVSDEMERYTQDLNRMREQAKVQMGGISDEIAKHREEIKAQAAAEIEKEKQQIVNQIDTKLADAVGSFLVETLGHNVDLGSQNAYLIEMLEKNKADFVKEVSGENKPK